MISTIDPSAASPAFSFADYLTTIGRPAEVVSADTMTASGYVLVSSFPVRLDLPQHPAQIRTLIDETILAHWPAQVRLTSDESIGILTLWSAAPASLAPFPTADDVERALLVVKSVGMSVEDHLVEQASLNSESLNSGALAGLAQNQLHFEYVASALSDRQASLT